MARIVVIGAGLGGMATASRLAVKRHDVTLVEASAAPGGQVRSIAWDGCTFELGPTTLTLPAVYRDLFLKTGGPLENELDLVPLEPATHYHFADGTQLELPGAGVGVTAAAVGRALGPASQTQWQELMAYAARIWALVRPGLTALPPPTGPALEALLDPTGRRPSSTLHHLLTRTLADPRARAVIADRVLPHPVDPVTAPATCVVGPYLTATFGAWHVAGGLHRIALALHERMQQRGVRIHLNTRALRIDLVAGRPAAVVVAAPDGTSTRLPADVVVADLPSAGAVQALLPPDAPRLDADRPKRLSSASPRDLAMSTARADRRAAPPTSPGRLTLLLSVLGTAAPGDAWEHVWLPADRQRTATRARHPAEPDPDPVIRAHIPDDPAMHPPGVGAWTIHVDVPPHSPSGRAPATMDWDAPGVADEHADRILESLSRRGTDLSGRIIRRAVHTPADQQRATGVPGGALLAEPMTLDSLRHRPGNVTAIPGLFLVGAATHPGPGLAMVGLSAEIVAQAVGRA